MANEVLTKAQIIEKLRNDPAFAVGFAVDNNYSAIVGKMRDMGIVREMSRMEVYSQIMDWIASNNQKAFEALNVPYVNEPPQISDDVNYTGGMDVDLTNEFSAVTGESVNSTRGFFSGLTFSSLFSGISGFFGGLAQQGTGATGLTSAQLAEIERQRIEEERRRAEEEERRKNRVTTIVVISVVVVAVIVISVLAFGGKKTPNS